MLASCMFQRDLFVRQQGYQQDPHSLHSTKMRHQQQRGRGGIGDDAPAATTITTTMHLPLSLLPVGLPFSFHRPATLLHPFKMQSIHPPLRRQRLLALTATATAVVTASAVIAAALRVVSTVAGPRGSPPQLQQQRPLRMPRRLYPLLLLQTLLALLSYVPAQPLSRGCR